MICMEVGGRWKKGSRRREEISCTGGRPGLS